MRQYALEKLGESGEADAVRSRHRDHYTSVAALLDTPSGPDYEQCVERAEIEMDNLRNALGWNLENRDTELALTLASSLQPVWHTRGRIVEGRAWFRTILTHDGRDAEDAMDSVAPQVRARALADQAVLNMFVGDSLDHGQRAVKIARELDDPALLARALTSCGYVAGTKYDPETAAEYFAEAIELARALDDRWSMSQILSWQSVTAITFGDPVRAREAGEEGRAIGDAIGDGLNSRQCRLSLGWADLIHGDVAGSISQFRVLLAECEEVHDEIVKSTCLLGLGVSLSHHGQFEAARAAAAAALERAEDMGEYFAGMGYASLAQANLAAGDIEAADVASEAAWQCMSVGQPQLAVAQRCFNSTEIAMSWRSRPRERRSWRTLALGRWPGGAMLTSTLPALGYLADLSSSDAGHPEAARLFGAAEAFRRRGGLVRYLIYEDGYQAAVAELRNAMEEKEFDTVWAEGAALSIEEAIAYAQRGRGERKRPASGWASLTPAERDVARLICEGLANKEIAMRLFVSPRTVQAHLSHIYAKLGITSRVQLVQEAARHA